MQPHVVGSGVGPHHKPESGYPPPTPFVARPLCSTTYAGYRLWSRPYLLVSRVSGYPPHAQSSVGSCLAVRTLAGEYVVGCGVEFRPARGVRRAARTRVAEKVSSFVLTYAPTGIRSGGEARNRMKRIEGRKLYTLTVDSFLYTVLRYRGKVVYTVNASVPRFRRFYQG